ncbi:hypothetical protein CERSUDRAFT_118597 [Gelatoporia subvermispora B]|uniref:Uncharacterized protein n=1 Tax=Ceriporiopsis subvermispora (strain B) TaxID=914234 RepID=M2QK92_CERS8|nr:hypothetical protein CERSUDRAFT_118597 [Gelatoporia subvermispora B]
MSEDDRAAKAARARALLKKRQAQKAAGAFVSTGSGIATPTSPPARAYSPALSEVSVVPTEDDKNERNVGDLFSKGQVGNGSDIPWLSSLARVEPTPPPTPPVPISPPPATSPPAAFVASQAVQEDLSSVVQDLRRRVSQLESEKAGLATSLEQKNDAETRALQTEQALQAEREKSHKLQELARRLEGDIRQLSEEVKHKDASLTSLSSEKTSIEASVRDVTQRLEGEVCKFSEDAKRKDASLASLTAEKAALEASVERLSTVEAKAQDTETALKVERAKSGSLSERLHELEGLVEKSSHEIQQQQQTISLLVSEKTSLTTAVERLEDAESRLKEADRLLKAERATTQDLRARVMQLEAEAQDSSSSIAELSASEKELADKCREQERELHLLHTTVNDLRAQAEHHERRVRELEEQIQSDDRAERLEATLQNTQDRADELEFQLSKLQQTHVALKKERDELEVKVIETAASEAVLQTRYTELEKQAVSTREELDLTTSTRDSLRQELDTLRSQAVGSQKDVMELQSKLSQLTTELKASTRQLQQTQAELTAATRRTDEAERTQKELQQEGTNLMRSLDEVRPKIVELTNAKLELQEKVEGLQAALRSRDTAIKQLEATVESLQTEKTRADEEAQAKADGEQASYESRLAQLRESLDALRDASTRQEEELVSRTQERDYARLEIQGLQAELARLTSIIASHTSELESLRHAISEAQQAHDMTRASLEQAQDELDGYRETLMARDAELAQARSAAAQQEGRLTPNSEVDNEHVLALSEAQARVRELEGTAFDADARAHAAQRRVAELEDELSQLLSAPQASRNAGRQGQRRAAGRPQHTTRPSSRLSKASETPSLSVFDGLSPETKHKRRVSLGMLKARIDSELAAARSGLPMVVEDASALSHAHMAAGMKPQFMDEAHVFWCSACQGDLVVL